MTRSLKLHTCTISSFLWTMFKGYDDAGKPPQAVKTVQENHSDKHLLACHEIFTVVKAASVIIK